MYTCCMPRVLHLIDHNGLGGAQQLLAGLLAARPDDLALALRNRQTRMIEIEDRLPAYARGRYFPGVLPLLPRVIREQRVDILHCHLRAAWVIGVTLAAGWARRGSPSVIFHEHNPYLLSSSPYRALLRLAARRGVVVAVSAHMVSLIRAACLPERSLALLENFISPQFFTFAESAPSTSPDSSIAPWRVGFSGRLDGVKGWRDFLQVAFLLRGEPFRFSIAGSGPDEARLRREVSRLGLNETVELAGFITDMPAFYRSLHVFLTPSHFESFGLTPLEAQACGVPVIAYDSPGVRDRLDPESALLVPVGQAHAMAAALRELRLDPGGYLRLAQAGRENARRFTLDPYLDRLEAIYRQVLIASGGAG